MRKYLLRIFTVLLIVCFGACLFAACGDDEEQGENPDEQPATYTLTYQANGGTGADITESHKEGEKVTLKGADAFTYEGHTFTGWNDGTAAYEAGQEFTMPASNVTFKAQWEEIGTDVPTYTIKVTDPSGKAQVKFDQQGPYHKGDVVTFTVDFAPGENRKVTSVKADGAELQKGEDGKYSVTFAEKDIEIVIASEAVEAHEFTVSISVSGGDNGNSATLDKEGTVGKGEKVTLTVVTAAGYTVEVKLNGSKVNLNAEGKYELTVTADAAFTVTFTKESTGPNPPQPSNKNFTEFALANILPLAERCQIAIQAKATGYASAEEMKGDVKLLIGTVEFSADQVTLAESGIYTLFFPIDVTTLNIAVDSSAAVTLKSIAANRTYDCPATGLVENQNLVQFEHDIYTLQYAAGSLTLKHTQVEIVEKKITFAGTAFDFDGEGKLYITLNLQTQGYEEAAVLAAKLKIGALEFSVRADASTKTALRFDLTGGETTVETLTAGQHAVVLVVGGDDYECPTVTTGQVGQQKKGEQTFTLKEDGGKLYLNVEGAGTDPSGPSGPTGPTGPSGPTDPTDKEIKEFGATNLITDGDGVAIFIRIRPFGYESDQAIKDDVKFSIGSLSLPIADLVVDNDFRILKYSITKAQVLAFTDGDLAVVITAGGKTYEKPCAIVSEAEFSKKMENKTIILNVKGEKLFLTVTTSTGPVEQEATAFADVNIVAEEGGFAIYVRVQTNGFADDDALKAGIKLMIGGKEIGVHSVSGDNFRVLRFLVTKEEVQSLTAGDHAIVLKVGNNSYEKPCTAISAGQPSADVDGKTYTLTEKDSKLYLNVK